MVGHNQWINVYNPPEYFHIILCPQVIFDVSMVVQAVHTFSIELVGGNLRGAWDYRIERLFTPSKVNAD